MPRGGASCRVEPRREEEPVEAENELQHSEIVSEVAAASVPCTVDAGRGRRGAERRPRADADGEFLARHATQRQLTEFLAAQREAAASSFVAAPAPAPAPRPTLPQLQARTRRWSSAARPAPPARCSSTGCAKSRRGGARRRAEADATAGGALRPRRAAQRTTRPGELPRSAAWRLGTARRSGATRRRCTTCSWRAGRTRMAGCGSAPGFRSGATSSCTATASSTTR